MKKLISVLLAVIFAISFSTVAFAAENAQDEKLRFNSEGKFKIMYICDVQDSYPMEEGMLALVGEALDAEKPDLVILGGDNIMSSDVRGYDQLLTLFTERNVKFDLVFGNHDHDSADKLTKEEQLAIYQTYNGCLARDADPLLSGCGTHNLPLMSSDGSRVAFNLWLFDSNDYCTYSDGTNDYDRVREDQIEWYMNKSEELQQDNGGKLVPSLAFQHIIVPEVYDALFFKAPFSLGKATKNFADGSHYFYIPNLFKLNGLMNEMPCPPYGNDGEWDAFVERKDVLGCAFGHDHINSFVVDYKGVDMIQTPGSTYNSYGDDLVRGVRIINLDENNPWTYETHVLTAAELAQKDGSKIPSITGTSVSKYSFLNIVSKVLFFIMDL